MSALPLEALPELRAPRMLRVVGGKDVDGLDVRTLPARPLPAVAPVPVAAPCPTPAAVPAAAASASFSPLVAVVKAAAVLGIVIGGVAALLPASSTPAVAATGAEVTVASGDTLWSIAEANRATGTATRDYVSAIIALNGLESAGITPGQELALPRLP